MRDAKAAAEYVTEGRGHRRRLVALAYPVYFELLASVAAGIVTMIWVARLGGSAVAAVAVATNVENLLLGLALIGGSGTTVLVAHARGAGDTAARRGAVTGGWAVCAVLAPAVAVGGFLLREPIAALVLGGAEGPEVALAAAYFAISLPGSALLFAQLQLDAVLKGGGDTRTPMRLALLAGGLILVLDPLLIDAYGIQGAALAMALGRAVALCCGLLVLRRHRTAGPRVAVVRAALRTLRTGLPMGADFLLRMAATLALVAVVGRLGVASVAAYGIATKAMYVATMAFYAVRQAAAIHTAHLLGGELEGREGYRLVGRQTLLVAGTLGTLAAGLLCAGAPAVLAAFGAGPEVAGQGAVFLRCLGPYLVLLACFIALGGVLEGSGHSARLLRITALGALVQLPLAYALSGLGLAGVALAMGLAAAVQCAALGLLVRRVRQMPAPVFSRAA
ncbi:polysaccharide biosynthesis C-terminal domain-containing protein [Streptomyces sp. TRM66268-LWL]|uniref:Probable multidrug resistance protein NorM n=1 Tax=Streptomyces polyasparticus TaxID=2767826 RepID=A0ABR7S9X8_9ACTN|nr:MATE family efflux transporter [Streptomyces polyasparticus]MBC9712280.1 polysaccharide biosynthesis C-terminal domain-containing protein [Streptomyces polyasparticus]